jgi:hypothetical protein
MRSHFARRHNVEIDLSGTTSMTADAITVLVSRLKDRRFTRGRAYRGNTPNDQKLKKQFTESGFYEYVMSAHKPKNLEYGSIRARSKLKVDPRKALELITLATKNLYQRYVKHGGVYKTLLECMNNTWDHAAGRAEQQERWWASVYCHENKKRASFTFIDNGVGIFESREPSVLQDAFVKLGIKKNTDMLRKMLRGEIASVTRIPYRGRGIPSIYDCFLRGGIENLIVITNDVYANVKTDDFRQLRKPFSGTLLYWEISK